MLAMYLLGIIVALLMAWLFKKTLLRGETPMLILELPPYKMPVLKVILRHIWDRSKLFLTRAGTVILGINILLWFLATYPKMDAPSSTHTTDGTNSTYAASEQLRHSFAGRMGHLIEPLIAPLGFDWKMGIGIIGSFAAREVFVSTMATVYSVEQSDTDEANLKTLVQTLQQQKRADGTQAYTTLTGLTLMVFYVFALQCVSTVAIVRRETNSWKWPVIQWLYMGVLAWGLAFATRHLGLMLGL
jgi:ferrous iron transport protein B